MAKSIVYDAKTGTSKEVTIPDFDVNIQEWHKENPFRVTVNNEVWKDWFAKKRDHSDYLELTGQQLSLI